MEKGKKLYVAHYMNVISHNVRKLRGTMSQGEFAKKVGISRTTVHRIESRKNFQVESMLKIADSLGLHPSDLCLPEEEKKRSHTGLDLIIDTVKEQIKRDILAELKKD